MGVPSRAAFADCLRAADRGECVGFVADLFEARGEAITDRTDTGFALDGGEGQRRVEIDTGEGSTGDGADVIVTVASSPPETDARLVTPADLHQQFCYAIGRERADELLERHFDLDLGSFPDGDTASADGSAGIGGRPGRSEPNVTGRTSTETQGHATTTTERSGNDADTQSTTATDGDAVGRDPSGPATSAETVGDGAETAENGLGPDAGGAERVEDSGGTAAGVAATDGGPATVVEGDGDGSGTGSSVRFEWTSALVGVAALVVVVGTLSGPGVPLGASVLGVFGAGNASSGGNGAAATGAAIEVNASELPPGVAPSGALDERTLAKATTDRLSDTSYRLTLVYREFVDGNATGIYTEEIRVENGRTYVADVTRSGTLVQTPPKIAGDDRYANGTVSVRRVDNGTTVTTGAIGPSDPFQNDLARYIRWYLSVESARITDRTGHGDATTYRITTEGDPYAGVTDTTGSALITREGLVWSLRRSYDDPYHTEVRAVVTIRITGVGTTTAPKPGWAE